MRLLVVSIVVDVNSPSPDQPTDQINQPCAQPNPTAKDPADLYFKGEVEACGYTFITDNKWTCTAQPPADDKWLEGDFDDSKWERAVWVRPYAACLPAWGSIYSYSHTTPG